MNIDAELSNVGLTRESFEAALSDMTDKANGTQDIDWSEIVDKYNILLAPETLRRMGGKPFGGPFVYEYFTNINNTSTDTREINEIRKERQKLNDERSALRKISRDNARIEQNLEHLEQLIKNKKFPKVNIKRKPYFKNGNNDLLISCHDIHYGLDINSSFGTYNTEIVSERFDKYFETILDIQETHGSRNAWVMLGGDLISGRIHNTVQLQNRENIVEQIQGVSEIISLFLYKLSQRFEHVYVDGTCGGNHSRLDQNKSEVLRGERLDLLVPWYINARLSVLENVDVINDSVDPTIAIMTIRGKNYLGVHGDCDTFTENGVHKLQAMIGYDKPIEAILFGHLHHCSYDDVANVKIVRSGSFCDPVDDYSISKRLVGHASQMVMVVDDGGIKTFYPVDLR